jgi:hypothetical protein
MNIELFLILSAAYNYVLHPEQDTNGKLRQYVGYGIESYMHSQGYMYDGDKKEWTDKAKLEDIARRRTQGAKDGWEIRRGKQRGKQ